MGAEHGKETWSKSWRGGDKTSIGSHVFTELFYCFLAAPSLTALEEAVQKGIYSDKHRLKRSVQSQEEGRREYSQPLLKVFLLRRVW